MNLSLVFSRAEVGIKAPLVSIEVHLLNGLPRTQIVGLAETAVRESKDRIKSALINSGYEYPRRVITINLGPADLPKHGCRYDLPIAMGILAAQGLISQDTLKKYELMGELSLSGDIKPVPGVLPAAMQILDTNRSLIIPLDNGQEASLLDSDRILTARNLQDIVGFFQDTSSGHFLKAASRRNFVTEDSTTVPTKDLQLSDVKGQYLGKRALAISAAGGHNLLMIGPPGSGKSMLASRMTCLLPPMNQKDVLELAAIRSVAALNTSGQSDAIISERSKYSRPFRTPHHSISSVALCGGGSSPRPGEISLAHNGVLFLDELPEFSRSALESLREPMESGIICISRARQKVTYPARFQLVATMNPCPCGYAGSEDNRCECTPEKVLRYRSRLSGPLLDRIDLHIEVCPLPRTELLNSTGQTEPEKERHLVNQIIKVREQSLKSRGRINAWLTPGEIEKYCRLNNADKRLLDTATERLGLSPRAYFKILKIALTISELDQSTGINTDHLTEAIGYRKLDRTRQKP